MELTMPSTSAEEARTVQAAVHDPAFAEKTGIPRRVAEDFVKADRKKAASGRKGK